MASTAAVFPLLFAALFTVTLAYYTCDFYRTSSGEIKLSVDCALPVSWDVGRFCCGTCEDRYCCSEREKKLSREAQMKCFLKPFEDLGKPPPRRYDASLPIGATIVGLIVFSILFLICWVCPCCLLHKKCRNPTPVIGTVVTTQILPQQIVINGGQYPSYQPLPNNTEYSGQPVPTEPYQRQPCVSGPPPSYQDAVGAGYPVSNSQPPYLSDQHPVHAPAHNPVPTDYSAPPAFNPAYVEPTKTGY